MAIPFCDDLPRVSHILVLAQPPEVRDTPGAGFRELFDEAPIAYHEIDSQGRLRRINRTECALLGYDASELLGKPVWMIVCPEERELSRRVVTEKLAGLRSLAPFVRTCLAKNGSRFVFEVHETFIRDSSGKPAGIRSALLNITGRRRAEATLLETEQCWRSVFDNSPDAMFLLGVTREGGISVEALNPTHERATGLCTAQLSGRPIAEVLAPEVLLHVLPRFNECIREGRSICYEEVLPALTGDSVWQTVLVPIRNGDGFVYRIAGISREITDTKRFEQTLRDRERLFRTLVEAQGEGTAIVDTSETFTFVNPAAERLFGVPAGTLVGRNLADFITPEQFTRVRKETEERRRGRRNTYEIEITRADGEPRDVLLTATPMFDEEDTFTGGLGVFRDITERKQSEQLLAESESRFRQFAMAAQDAIIVLDQSGAINFWNRAAEQMFGYSDAEAQGRDLYSLILSPGRTGPLPSALLFEGLGQWKGGLVEQVAVRKNGESFHAEIALSRFRFKGEWNIIGSVRDITERKRYEQSLANYAAELEAARRKEEQHAAELQILVQELDLARNRAEAGAQAKSEFLAAMSHEIRTPMNGVIGMTGLLLDTELSPEQRGYADAIRTSADSLLSVINDILDFSKIEAGRLQLECAEFDLQSCLEDIVEILLPTAAGKGLELALHYTAGTPRLVVGDAGRIRQIVLNLAGNALKFTAHGHVLIEAAMERLPDGRPRFRLAVSDTGCGIPEEHLSIIFEKFTQLGAASTRRHGGTGLGLAITRQLVELMGGAIRTSSTPGRGSVFTCLLPLEPARLPTAGEARPAESEPALAGANGATAPLPLKGRRILMAEDNPVNQKLGVRLLEKLGCRVDVAANGLEVIQMTQAFPYDLVLMDCQMPELDGFEATQAIRRDPPAARRIPIIAMTAYAMQGDRERCLNAGMDDFISKPVSPAKLKATLLRWLQ